MGFQEGFKHCLALKAWKDLCQPKFVGGLGFKLCKDVNYALLAKLGWKVAGDDDRLWCRILRAKFVKGRSFFDIKMSKGCSSGWHGILSSRKFLMKGACYKIGNGLKVNPWNDQWLPELEGKISKLKEGVDARWWSKVRDLRMEDNSGWNLDLIKDLCTEYSGNAILN